MGNTRSQNFEQVSVDPWWNNNKQNSTKEEETNKTLNSAKMSEIQEEISSIRERRLQIISEKKQEMTDLRHKLAETTLENEELKRLLKVQNGELVLIKVDSNQQTDPFEIPGPSNQTQLENEELKAKIEQIASELENTKLEVAAFENERKEYSTHVIALKDIIAVSKQLLILRDSQIKELGQKIDEIQASLVEKELTAFSDELRQEYEKQLKNMKQLRVLYEERQRLDKAERSTLKNNLEEAKRSLDYRETRNSELQARIDELEKDNSEKYDTITGLQSQLGLSKAECRDLKTELSVINQLFSQILVGFNNGQDVNLDKLVKLLEENHDLLTDIIVNEDCHEVSSTLPKVLLDLINQVDAKTNELSDQTTEEQQEEGAITIESAPGVLEPPPLNPPNALSTPSEIVQNLPKVWRVLTELLSHQSTPISVLDNDDEGDHNPCYKSVQTPTGPTLVLSVSKTFIRLKDLIVEKKSLEKETMRLKQLNTHLETRLQDQEKRLELVSSELSKTWNVVGKMQKQHQQLHTQEKILRYELAQKRKLLNELKEELEYCREKWLQAREKNSHTEEQWKQLRNEFIARKSVVSEELTNSGESGYSDDRESSSSDEDDANGKTAVENSNLVKMDSIAELNESENVQPIFEVIQEEIANIESGAISPDDESSEISNGELPLASDENTPANIGSEVIRPDDEPLSETSSRELPPPLDQNIESEAIRSDDEPLSETSSRELPSPLDQNIESEAIRSDDEPLSETSSRELPPPLDQNNESEAISRDDEPLSETSSWELPSTSDQNTTATIESEVISPDDALSSVTSSRELPSPLDQNIESEVISPDAEYSSAETSNRESPSPSDENTTANIESIDEEPSSETSSWEPSHNIMPNEIPNTSEISADVEASNGLSLSEIKEKTKTQEEKLLAKENRFKRLENEAKSLVEQTTNTSNRSVEICTKLDNLHEQYGNDDAQIRRKNIDDMYKKLEEDILQTIIKTQNGDLSMKQGNEIELYDDRVQASTSSARTSAEIFAKREERLQRMEEQAQQLVKRVQNNSFKSSEICSKLNLLHERCVESSQTSTSEDLEIDDDEEEQEENKTDL